MELVDPHQIMEARLQKDLLSLPLEVTGCVLCASVVILEDVVDHKAEHSVAEDAQVSLDGILFKFEADLASASLTLPGLTVCTPSLNQRS